MKNLSLILLVAVLFSGCYTTMTNSYPVDLNKEKVQEYKNYKMNTKSVSFVGQPIIRIKNVVMHKYKSIHVIPENDFTMNISGNSFLISKDVTYKVKGHVLKSDEIYKAIAIKPELDFTYQTYYMLLDMNNKIVPFIWRDGSFSGVSISGNNTVSVNTIISDVPKKGTNFNIELLYNGTNKDGLKLLYREYTADDLARQAFYQNLIYDTNQKEIRFKNFLLKIHASNNQELVYTILRDNFKEDVVSIQY